MKKIIVLAILSLNISGIAQERKVLKNNEKSEFTSEQKNELQVKKLTLELDLTAQQQKDIAEIVGKQQMNREKMRSEIKDKRSSNKKLTADEKFVLKKSMLDEKINYKNQIKKVLTPTQLEKWENMPKHNAKKEKLRMKRKAQVEK